MRGRLVVALLFGAASLQGQPAEQYQFKIVDVVYRVESIGARVEDFTVKQSEVETRLELNADVLFEFDKADLLPRAEEVLKKAAAYLRDDAKGAVRIEGHTDSKGDDAYNLRLSVQRAEAVKRWFAQNAGVDPGRMSTRGFGEKNPVAPNSRADGTDDPEGRQKNRRVEIVIAR